MPRHRPAGPANVLVVLALLALALLIGWLFSNSQGVVR